MVWRRAAQRWSSWRPSTVIADPARSLALPSVKAQLDETMREEGRRLFEEQHARPAAPGALMPTTAGFVVDEDSQELLLFFLFDLAI